MTFGFLPDGDEEESRLTYRELDVKARAIAASLQQQGAVGQRLLVICRPGLDGIAGVFGCFYAGAVALPVDHWVSQRFESVVPDAQARFALATAPAAREPPAAPAPPELCCSAGITPRNSDVQALTDVNNMLSKILATPDR